MENEVRGSVILMMPLLASLNACATTGDRGVDRPSHASDASVAAITVSVGPCFGFCPVYDVTVSEKGDVHFSGKRHTAFVGDRDRTGGAAVYGALARDLATFRPADGTTAQVECTAAISDTSSYTIIWTAADGRKTVATHQRGCIGGPGKALDGVLAKLPGDLGIADWAKQTTRPGLPRG
jgi:hypothetical protein